MSLPQRSTSRKFYDIVIITILSGFLLFSSSFSKNNMSFAYAASIVLFEDVQFKGIKSTLRVGDSSTCVNLVGKLNDFYSSVDTMGVCFVLCEHLNCNGKCEQVRGKLGDLTSVGLNDHVSSLTLCAATNDGALSSTSENSARKRRRKRNTNVKESAATDISVQEEKIRGAKKQSEYLQSVKAMATVTSRSRLPSEFARDSKLVSSTNTPESRVPVPRSLLELGQLLRAAAASTKSKFFRVTGGSGRIPSSNNNQSKDSTSRSNRVENYHRQRISMSPSSSTTQLSVLSSSNQHRRKRRRLVVNHVRDQHQKQ